MQTRNQLEACRLEDTLEHIGDSCLIGESFSVTLIDNHNPEDRRRLIEALWSFGFRATEYDSGGGTTHVVVPILEEGDDLLQIATGEIESRCDVSLMGWRRGEQVQADTWIAAQSMEDAIIHFEKYFQDREQWIERFYLGEMDI